MSTSGMDIILFGDQAIDIRTFLKKVLLRQNSYLLSSFLSRSYDVLRHEVSQLPKHHRVRIPAFSTVHELVERYYSAGREDCAVESSLACVAQLAHYISFYEDKPQSYVTPGNTLVVGVCTGLFAASAVASCTSLAALVPLAAEAVRVAFRTGARVSLEASSIEGSHNGHGNWSKTVTGIESTGLTAALEEFNKSQVSFEPPPHSVADTDFQALSNSNKVYVSATSATAMTVSGPPSILRRLFDGEHGLNDVSQRDLPIYGPYHAPHIYTRGSAEIITEGTKSTMKLYQRVHRTFCSEFEQPETTVQLFEKSVMEVLASPIDWQADIRGCLAEIKRSSTSKCHILAMGPTTLGASLQSSLRSVKGLEVELVDHTSWLSEPRLTSGANDSPGCNIAIVGMSGRFPDAADLESFWKLLEEGLDVHRMIPPDRFDAEAHTDPSGKGKNKTHTPYGCFIEDPGLFDQRFFNMSPREAAQTDPMQRLAITTAYEAMESSGFVLNRTPSTAAPRVGTFYGQTSDDWREINAAQDIDTYFITGGVRAFGPGRINFHFGFSGPSFNVDTACSSSFAAIQIACRSLEAGDCDTAFTGGANVMTNPDIFSGLSKGQFLSKTGSCKTYDNDADGYCRGDGVVTLILKRVEDALQDRDPILGIIRGTATNHSAEAVSITHPHAGAQEFLFQKIMDQTGVDARSVKYVEMHGTGTQAGDGIEITSVTNVFAPQGRRKRRADQPLFIGSAKANIGHGEAVSGACSLVKVLLMFQKNTIPPHCGIKGEMNKGFPKDLKERSVNIAFTPRKLSGKDKRYIFINNFSAAGGNTAMLVEDAPARPRLTVDPRSSHVFVVSAKSLSSFKKNARQLLSWIDEHPDFNFSSLAYTTTARRHHYNYRAALVSQDTAGLQALLRKAADAPCTPVSSTPPPVAFAFTGQGAQYSNMAGSLYKHSESFRRSIESLCDLAESQGFDQSPILGILNGTIKDIKSESPVSNQLAMTILQIALARFWQSIDVVPSMVIGHSLGEYAALHVAGVLSASDTIYLVGMRAQLMQSDCKSNTHGMLAVRGSKDKVLATVKHLPIGVEVACINAPEETVLSGLMESINAAENCLIPKGLKCTKLSTPYAFHSSQLDPIYESFQEVAKSAVFHPPKLPIISPLLNKVIQSGGVISPQYLARHMRETVNFLGGLQAGETLGQDFIWVEIGPHPICSNMVKSTINSESQVVTTPSLVRNENSWKTISSSVSVLYEAGINVSWSEFHRGFETAHAVLPIPTYSFDSKVYWLQYKNDWTLTKGEISVPKPARSIEPPFSTTSVQRIIKEEVSGNHALVIGESDLCEPLLKTAVSGHVVSGAPLCPSSIFADMALTLCEYAHKLLKPNFLDDGMGYDVCNMEVHKPLVLDLKATSQIIQISIEFDLGTSTARVQYKSIQSNGSTVDHAQCGVKIAPVSHWENEYQRRGFLARSRIEALSSGPQVHTIHRGMAYKLFKALVDYDPKYRGMEEVLLDSQNLEATARIVFQAEPHDGNFVMSPYFIDSVCHISGFIVNATDGVDSASQVYISHGWESMRFAKKLVAGEKYRSYVKMDPAPGASQVLAGDVYVFTDDERLIGIVGGLKFQCVPRRLLDTMLGPKGSSGPRNTPASKAIAREQNTRVTPLNSAAKPDKSDSNDSSSESEGTSTPLTELDENLDDGEQIISTIRSTIANEMGVDIEEISDTADLSTMGMDSLMCLSILGVLREETGVKFDADFLNENVSVAQMKKTLGFDKPSSKPKNSNMYKVSASPLAAAPVDLDVGDLAQYPQAPCILLQGNPKTATQKIFLLPDGSGSATSYTGIPELGQSIAVFGLNCPFMKTPEQFTIGVRTITRIYKAAIKKRQPVGPYVLGGWSAGGVLAYEMTRQLVAEGETVSKLLLLDSPYPIKLDALPSSFHRFCNRIGLLGDGVSKSPDWLLPHFAATVRELTNYSEWLESLPEVQTANMPRTTLLWARHGIVSKKSAERPEWDEQVPMPNSMFWLCYDRTDFGHNKWDLLLGEENIRCVEMDGNHFTMMRDPAIKELGRLIKEALDAK
ncbi:Non-reducing polyketide synthase PKS12 [Lachnellula suecica]|uniref:Non-reducing polyketide synthase PKS12 n=1 Tax=Lachnellula suecica TaxID=602035 RepID=A0A8T9CF64_9HELO|nr:Non-reducing polyketide synthase PKS12 [Lachnellula suecica]